MNDPDFHPEAFLVDLDGVLVHSHEAHEQAYEEAFRRHGLELTPAVRALVHDGLGRTRVLAHADVPAEMRRELADAKEEAFLALLDAGALRAADGVEAFLRTLAEAGCPAAVVSNSATAQECVTALGWGGGFRAVVGAGDVQRAKPDPEPYRLGARRLGVRPERCVALEDSEAGASSARAAGAFVVGVGPALDPENVDAWAPSLADVPVARWLAVGERAGGAGR